MLDYVQFDDRRLAKAMFPDTIFKKLNGLKNKIELAGAPNPLGSEDDWHTMQQLPKPPQAYTALDLDGDAGDGLKPIDSILHYLMDKSQRLYNGRSRKWNSWPKNTKKNKGSREGELATYLNRIVDAVRCFLSNGEEPVAHPDDWIFSARYCNSVIPCDGPEQKSDIVIIPDKDALYNSWRNIRGFGVLKSIFRDSREDLIEDLAEYARSTFKNDGARRFVLCFTIRQAKMQLVKFDRSGSVTSHEFNVHKDPHSFIRVIVGLLLGDDYYIGLDPSFTREGTSRFVTLNNKRYKIIKTLQLERVIHGRGTVAFLVKSEDGVLFVIKDQWVDRARSSKEPDIMKHLTDQNVEGVAKIVEYQIIHFNVEGKIVKDSTETDRNSDSSAEIRDHYRLLISPYGDKLENFSSLKELVSAFKDYVQVIIDLHKAGVVHRDISLNNLILVGNKGGVPRKGYIIDFDNAILVERLVEIYANAEAERTGTYPFMAIEVLLDEMSSPHSYYHDLESLFYVLIWICFPQKCPNGLLRTESEFKFEKSPLWGWYNLRSETSLKFIGNAKFGQMISESAFKHQIISQLPDYFKPLSKLLIALRRILFRLNDKVDIETVPDKDRCIEDRDPELVLVDINKVFDTALEDLSKPVKPVNAIDRAQDDAGKPNDAVVDSSIPPLSTCCLEAIPHTETKKEKELAIPGLTREGTGLVKVEVENVIRSVESKRKHDQEETTLSGPN